MKAKKFNLSKAIKKSTKDHKIKLSELAERMGTTRQVINTLILRGNCNCNTLIKISNALQIKLSDFIKYGE